MKMIERVGWAIANVALWSRFNDWTSDRVEGFPIEICRYGVDEEPDIVVIRRFPRDVGETEALTVTVMEERAKAAIEAMQEPTGEMTVVGDTEIIAYLNDERNVKGISTPAANSYRAMIGAALQEGKETVE